MDQHSFLVAVHCINPSSPLSRISIQCSSTYALINVYSVAYLKFGSGGWGVRALQLALRGQFIINYNNFVRSENTISEHIAIFKKISASSLNIYRTSLDFINISLAFNILF